MSGPTHKVYSLEIRSAELDGMRGLISSWNIAPANINTQSQWRALMLRLKNDDVIQAFRNDSGISTNNINNWSIGENLPTPHMCRTYINLLTEKMDEELQRLEHERQKLLSPPPEKSTSEKRASLPEKTILSFELPESTPAGLPITELEGYNDLSSRARNCLKNDNIITAKDLTDPPYRKEFEVWQVKMRRMPNFGNKSIAQVYNLMLRNGFKPTFG